MPTNYFDERIAKSYEARWPELFEPAVVWGRAPFTSDSRQHVSIWEKPA